jgi:hypothetical protein
MEVVSLSLVVQVTVRESLRGPECGQAIFENLEAGACIDDILQWFGLTCDLTFGLLSRR